MAATEAIISPLLFALELTRLFSPSKLEGRARSKKFFQVSHAMMAK
jgi:hypothetical protein